MMTPAPSVPRLRITRFLLAATALLASLPAVAQHIPEVMAAWQSAKRSAIAGHDGEDAVIIFNNQYVEVALATSGYVAANTWTTTHHRKIRVNTLAGIEVFNRVYVPLYEDLMMTSKVIKIEGRTIKKDGTVVNVEPEFIRQTTLPANAPLLAGYRGKVSLFAFSNLEAGDEVEYFHTVQYQTTVSAAQKKYFHSSSRIEIGDDYPILLEKHVFYLDKIINLKSFCFNGTLKFDQVASDMPKKERYEVVVKDLPADINEVYDNDYYSKPLLTYTLYVLSEGGKTDWSDVLEYFMVPMPDEVEVANDLTIGNLISQVKSKPGASEKIDAFHRLLADHYIKKPETIGSLERSALSWYWISVYRKLMLDLKIPASLLFVKDKKYGPLEEAFPNFNQFDDCLLQYKDEQGAEHYLQINQPFFRKDEIPYMYEGTKALKMTVGGSSASHAFVQLPPGKSSDNVREVRHDFTLSLKSGRGSIRCARSVTDKGHFACEQRNSFIAEKLDSSLGWFSQAEKSRLFDYFSNPKVAGIELVSHDDGQLAWKEDFSFDNHAVAFTTGTVIRLADFMESIFRFSPSARMNRRKDAYFAFPYQKSYTLSITAPSGYRFQENELLLNSLDNPVAEFVSSYETPSPGTIIIRYRFNLKKAMLKKEEWQQFIEVVDRAYEFSQMRLLLKQL